jgi:hypothetical protein
MGTSVTRRLFLGMAVAGGATLRLTQEELAMTSDPPTPIQSGYAPINGLQMYYEIHGGGCRCSCCMAPWARSRCSGRCCRR